MQWFKMSEFECRCCGKKDMDEAFLERLDKARGIADVVFVIVSGFRCKKHNKMVGGKPESAHMVGKAADIHVSGSRARFRILKGLIEAGFTRIGIYPYFIHVDSDETKDQDVAWY